MPPSYKQMIPVAMVHGTKTKSGSRKSVPLSMPAIKANMLKLFPLQFESGSVSNHVFKKAWHALDATGAFVVNEGGGKKWKLAEDGKDDKENENVVSAKMLYNKVITATDPDSKLFKVAKPLKKKPSSKIKKLKQKKAKTGKGKAAGAGKTGKKSSE
jgi:hypothetical protein